VVETTHQTVRDALVKVCKGEIWKWYKHTPYIFWADQVTTHTATGHTPYYMTYGVEPLFLFDITEARYPASSHMKTYTGRATDYKVLSTRKM
jgi:hypothetical protein